MDSLKSWWLDTAWPAIRAHTAELLAEWWLDLEAHPGLHVLSMILGAAVLTVVSWIT